MLLVEKLLVAIAKEWKLESRPKLQLIGSTALMLRTSYARGTKDSDVLQTAQLDDETRAHLLEIAGRETVVAKQYGMYVEIVPNGLPFLPHPPKWHAVSIEGASDVLDIQVLDVVDVVVSKVKRLNANDVTDIAAMIERGLVPHDVLLERFRSAMDECAHTASADDLPKYISNLNQVERDMLLVEESDIELPSWV